MQITPISFKGIPTGPKSHSKESLKALEFGLPTTRYKTPVTKESLKKQIEYYREVLKENPENEFFRKILEDCSNQLRILESSF